MLRLENILIRQGEFHLSADWEVAAGSRLALIGPSGGGKSTLLSVIAGLFAPVAGRILVGGHDITDLPPGLRPVSLLFQDHNLFPHLSVAQNVGLGLRPDLKLSGADHKAVAAGLARVGLAGLGTRLPAQLSGGQQQRVALARALLQARPVLMLDEPFAALGPALKTDMLDLVAEITAEAGITLLMVTHDPGDAFHLAREVSLVAGGVAQAPVETKALFAKPPPALAEYLGSWGKPSQPSAN